MRNCSWEARSDYDQLLTSSKGPRAAHEFTSAEALRVLSRQNALQFQPGEKWEYSNSGYVVLAQIVERVSGKRYAEFLKENIFDPLGMHDTLLVGERRQPVPRLATRYGQRGGSWKNIMYSPVNFIYGEDGPGNGARRVLVRVPQLHHSGARAPAYGDSPHERRL